MPPDQGAEFWFKSSLFEIEPGEDEETNPLCYGRQLANWLRGKLVAKGHAVEEVIPEDWGWCVMCARKPFRLWVGCGSTHDYGKTSSDDPSPRGIDVTWHCFVVAEQSLLGRLFRRVDTSTKVKELSRHVGGILRAQAEIIFTEKP